jgi:hypothetical protein
MAAVLRFKRNAPRARDRVVVHDSGRAAKVPVSGVVATVNALKGSNGVGIRAATVEERRPCGPPS